VLALTGLGLGVGVYVTSDRDVDTAAEAAVSRPTTRAVSLPAGWRPWQTKLRYDLKGVPLDYGRPGCVTDQDALFCGGTGFTVARVDAASGRVLWRVGTRPQGAPPIGVRDGTVYVYADPDDKTRRVVALDAATGRQKWRRDINGSA
ncbi:outer membrane protein assembly factor BamB family protein, partial [Streptomyces litchfieldiae]